MKIRCGTDIIEISRIKQSIDRQGDTFLNKIYTKNEIEYCESKGKQKYQHYAARFAAKEAAFKAISLDIKDKYNVEWKDFEILSNASGRPYLNLKNTDINIFENIDISLSHCKEYAVANVVILYK